MEAVEGKWQRLGRWCKGKREAEEREERKTDAGIESEEGGRSNVTI